jgi:RND family efflux transporter MFP subunit
MSNLKIIFSGAAVLCGLFFLSSCSPGNASTRSNGTDSPAALTVAVAKAAPRDLSNGVVLTAEFLPYQEVDVMAKVAGFVSKINVDIGDRVAAGQQLALLEVPEMQQDILRGQAAIEHSSAEVQRARKEVQRAESNHDIAHLSYTRLAAVNKDKPHLVAQQEIDDAHSKDLAAEAQIDVAKAALDAAEHQVQVTTAEQGRTKALFDYTNVTAPFTGVVTKRYANTGSMIQAGTSSSTQALPIVRLSQNNLLRLILPVPESIVPRIKIGQTVQVNVPSLHRNFTGQVKRVEDKLDLSTRTMNTEVDVENPTLILIPGMYAEVNLILDQAVNVLCVPLTAVDSGTESGDSANSADKGHSGTVMMVTADNQIATRKVRLGLETSNFIEVISGLSEGDMVVIGNRANLQQGQEVKPKLTSLSPSSADGAETK